MIRCYCTLNWSIKTVVLIGNVVHVRQHIKFILKTVPIISYRQRITKYINPASQIEKNNEPMQSVHPRPSAVPLNWHFECGRSQPRPHIILVGGGGGGNLPPVRNCSFFSQDHRGITVKMEYLRRNWDPFPASECGSPQDLSGEETNSLSGEGGGGTPFRRDRHSGRYSTACIVY
jgi:hypothetical protein